MAWGLHRFGYLAPNDNLVNALSSGVLTHWSAALFQF
jgi:hypothetical protein